LLTFVSTNLKQTAMARTTIDNPNVNADNIKKMSLNEIANIIFETDRVNWRNTHGKYYGAIPYLDAMSTLQTINDPYMFESGETQVRYFLSNATTWQGQTAKIVKAELNRRLKK
jgi:hypothetical protein